LKKREKEKKEAKKRKREKTLIIGYVYFTKYLLKYDN